MQTSRDSFPSPPNQIRSPPPSHHFLPSHLFPPPPRTPPPPRFFKAASPFGVCEAISAWERDAELGTDLFVFLLAALPLLRLLLTAVTATFPSLPILLLLRLLTASRPLRVGEGLRALRNSLNIHLHLPIHWMANKSRRGRLAAAPPPRPQATSLFLRIFFLGWLFGSKRGTPWQTHMVSLRLPCTDRGLRFHARARRHTQAHTPQPHTHFRSSRLFQPTCALDCPRWRCGGLQPPLYSSSKTPAKQIAWKSLNSQFSSV